MTKLFISYSRKDSEAARKIIQALNELKYDAWVDWKDISPAADWMDQILRGIESVDAFIFLVSPDSIVSDVCKVEVSHAAKNNKRIIPVVVRQAEPGDAIEIVRHLNWIFVRPEDSFENGIAKIKVAIELDIEWVQEHNRLQLRALEWHREKDASLLLRGHDLHETDQILKQAERKDPEPTRLQKLYVEHSLKNEFRNRLIRGSIAITVAALITLTYIAVAQSQRAQKESIEANNQRVIAEQNADLAQQNEKDAIAAQRRADTNAQKAIREKQAAEKAKQQAEESRNKASAQRSAARAQIYQFKSGELYTSTLLAIASWQTSPSAEAEEILRANISLLPLPIKQMTHAGQINSLEFNKEGNLFVTAGGDGTICVWQTMDGETVFCVDSPGGVNDAIFSPTEDIIVSGDNTGVVQIIDIKNKAVEKSFEFESSIRDVEIRYDGFYAVVTTESGIAHILDLTKRSKANISLPGFNLKFATFSSRGLQIAGGNSNGLISIWELGSNGTPFETRKHNGEIITAKFSPKGQLLITGGADGAVVVLDAKTHNEIYRRQHGDQVNDIEFNNNGTWFVTVSSDRSIRMWDTATGSQLLSVSQSNVVQKVRISNDGRWLATTGDDKTVRVWSAINGAQLFQAPLKGKGTTLGISKDGNTLIAGDQFGNIYMWDMSDIVLPVSSLKFSGLTSSALYSPNGNRIAVADDRRIWLLNPNTLSPLITTPPGTPYAELLNNVDQIVFGAKSSRIGALTSRNDIATYNLQTRNGKIITPSNPARAFVFSLDERQAIIGDSAGELEVWDAVSHQYINSPITFNQRIIAMTASDKLLAVGTSNTIYILDINTLAEISQLKTENDYEYLIFSPDGSWLASNGTTDPIQLWQEVDGKFTGPHLINRNNVISIAFHPQNKLLAIGSVDVVYLIDPSTLNEYARLPQTGTVNSVAFSSDGNTLMTASLKTLQFWDWAKIPEISEDNLIEIACKHVIENFNEAQWSRLFETEDYMLLCPDLPVAP